MRSGRLVFSGEAAPAPLINGTKQQRQPFTQGVSCSNKPDGSRWALQTSCCAEWILLSWRGKKKKRHINFSVFATSTLTFVLNKYGGGREGGRGRWLSVSHSYFLAAGEGSTFSFFSAFFLKSACVGRHLPALTFGGCDFALRFFSSRFPAALQS